MNCCPMPKTLAIRLVCFIAGSLACFASVDLSTCRATEVTLLSEALKTISEDDLRAHVEVLADDSLEGREAGSRGGHAAAKYLALLFKKYGLKPFGDGGSYYQSFGNGYRNILGVLPGSDPSLEEQYIVVGAHYDHVGYGSRTNSYGPYGAIHNGADDNASGTSAVLELIEALHESELRPRRSILFCFWDSEEKGLLGSKHWIANPTVDLEKVKFSINLDMIGRLRDEGLSIYGERTASGLRPFLSRVNEEQLKLQFNWDLKADSDHYPFIQNRIPTVMMHTGLHGEYHRPSDDIETLNYPGMQAVTRYVARTVWELADQQELFQFRDDAMRESEISRKRFERAAPPFPTRLGVALQSTKNKTLRIGEVLVGSPAERAGLREGQQILGVNGQSLGSEEQLWNVVFDSPEALVVKVQDSKNAEPKDLSVQLVGRPLRIGLSWRLDQGHPGVALVSRISRHSRADRAGLKPGQRIYSVNGKKVSSDLELQRSLVEAEEVLQLQVESSGQIREFVIDLTGRGEDRKDGFEAAEN
jgi:hypothetical protein